MGAQPGPVPEGTERQRHLPACRGGAADLAHAYVYPAERQTGVGDGEGDLLGVRGVRTQASAGSAQRQPWEDLRVPARGVGGGAETE